MWRFCSYSSSWVPWCWSGLEPKRIQAGFSRWLLLTTSSTSFWSVDTWSWWLLHQRWSRRRVSAQNSYTIDRLVLYSFFASSSTSWWNRRVPRPSTSLWLAQSIPFFNWFSIQWTTRLVCRKIVWWNVEGSYPESFWCRSKVLPVK